MLAAKYGNGGAHAQLFEASLCKKMRIHLRSEAESVTPLMKVLIYADLSRFKLCPTSINQIKSVIGSAFISDAVVTR
jgi:hypothetical protein